MWQAQILPPDHYEFHELQFQAGVEVLLVGLEGFVEALVLEEKVWLLVLDVLLWSLPKVCALFEQLVLMVPVPVGEQAEFSISWVEDQPLLLVSRAEN